MEEAKGVQDQGQPIEWQPTSQRNISARKMLIRVVWQSTNDGIADELERDSLDLIKILAVRLRFSLIYFRKYLYFVVK